MKYDKQRKALAHAKAVENATHYLLALNSEWVWSKQLIMLRLPIKLKEENVLPPLDVVRL